VDQPLQIRRCKKSGRDYLLCDYNRDGDSYRSPWSNEFDPPLDDGTVPSERVRKLEISANEAFDVYRELYYEGGVGSVYFWDLDNGFAGVVLLKKGEFLHNPNIGNDYLGQMVTGSFCSRITRFQILRRLGQHPRL
jgi:capping protein beta